MSNLVELRKIMLEHQKADQLVQGAWWDSEEKTGCFYGCAVHENDESAIEKAIQKFGIEPWIAYWSEQVFEGLPQKLALNWPVELLDAMIQFEGDYKDIYHKLSIKRLENLPNTNDENVNQAIKKVIEYHLNPTEDKRKEAHSAANSAANSAAGSAAWAARLAAESAQMRRHVRRQSAARSAEWAAYSAASSADRRHVLAAAGIEPWIWAKIFFTNYQLSVRQSSNYGRQMRQMRRMGGGMGGRCGGRCGCTFTTLGKRT